ncbi:molybdenum cofactor guanylyltransferase [Halorarum salinum]|uniref:Probable molybdenum cofactor guanylyltransferase n=1 Tax=Halorarum salinum TaxID=2743089 RepID=A0A7D5L9X1_9EURY|nr:molybdenum cofactor guanylyltransferase [Halobaculum salinum]QLG61407.1 molybdenum cofactor guanylyltransferase [Halobaculum salinum]
MDEATVEGSGTTEGTEDSNGAERRYAVVIAGGRSTRFGDSDKAVAPLAGTPMIRRVADRLAGVTDRLVVNCRPDQREAIADALAGYPNPVRYAEDEEPDLGPMAGIRTGLRGVEAWGGPDALAFVAACDMPFLDPGLVSHLFDRAADRDAAVPRLDDEWFQTTHAVYRAGPMADACDAALAEGEGKIIAPLFELDHAVVEEDEALRYADESTFENLNTRKEFEAAAERFG